MSLRCEARVGVFRWSPRYGEQCRRNARFTDGERHICAHHAQREGAYVEEHGTRRLKPGWRFEP